MVFVEKSKVVSWVLYFVFCLIMVMLSIKLVLEFWFCLTSDLSDQRYVDRHQVWRFFCLSVWNNLIIFVIITEQMRGIVEPPNWWNSLSIIKLFFYLVLNHVCLIFSGSLSPYCIVSTSNPLQRKRTTMVRDNENPFWNEYFTL